VLVAQGRSLVYARATRSTTAGRYLSSTMFEHVASLSRIIAVSLGFVVGSTLLGVLWALRDPSSAAGLVPGVHVVASNRGGFYGISLPARGGLAAVIFAHNIAIALCIVAGGLTFGIGTALFLSYNGAMLGMLGTLEWRVGGFSSFLRLVVPHGLLELSCITLAGAAGFAIARALIRPGRLTRVAALEAALPQVGSATLCAAGFLVVAGSIEGIVTPWDLSLPVALTVGTVACSTFWGLVVVRGRRPSRSTSTVVPGVVPVRLVRAP